MGPIGHIGPTVAQQLIGSLVFALLIPQNACNVEIVANSRLPFCIVFSSPLEEIFVEHDWSDSFPLQNPGKIG